VLLNLAVRKVNHWALKVNRNWVQLCEYCELPTGRNTDELVGDYVTWFPSSDLGLCIALLALRLCMSVDIAHLLAL